LSTQLPRELHLPKRVVALAAAAAAAAKTPLANVNVARNGNGNRFCNGNGDGDVDVAVVDGALAAVFRTLIARCSSGINSDDATDGGDVVVVLFASLFALLRALRAGLAAASPVAPLSRAARPNNWHVAFVRALFRPTLAHIEQCVAALSPTSRTLRAVIAAHVRFATAMSEYED
jgi:hypothetical protein